MVHSTYISLYSILYIYSKIIYSHIDFSFPSTNDLLSNDVHRSTPLSLQWPVSHRFSIRFLSIFSCMHAIHSSISILLEMAGNGIVDHIHCILYTYSISIQSAIDHITNDSSKTIYAYHKHWEKWLPVLLLSLSLSFFLSIFLSVSVSHRPRCLYEPYAHPRSQLKLIIHSTVICNASNMHITLPRLCTSSWIFTSISKLRPSNRMSSPP